MSRTRVVRAFSAGGVVFRRAADAEPLQDTGAGTDPLAGVEIALVGRPQLDIWVLPKGTPHPGESVEDSALREVREETGLITQIVNKAGSIHYTFSRDGTRFNKEVFHYVLEATGGDVSLHDAEYEEARWFPLAEAHRRLTFRNEVDLLERAEPLIARYLAEKPAVSASAPSHTSPGDAAGRPGGGDRQ